MASLTVVEFASASSYRGEFVLPEQKVLEKCRDSNLPDCAAISNALNFGMCEANLGSSCIGILNENFLIFE